MAQPASRLTRINLTVADWPRICAIEIRTSKTYATAAGVEPDVRSRIDTMKKALIAFYSRTGRTRQVAHAISRRCDAHLEDIQLAHEPNGWRGYLYSALSAIRQRTPALGPLEHAVGDYDLVIVGTPIWAFHVCSPVRSYLVRVHDSLRDIANVAFFCTMGGAGAERVFGELRTLTGHTPIATLALNEREVDANQYSARVAQFAEQLAGRGSPPPTPAQRHAILRTIK